MKHSYVCNWLHIVWNTFSHERIMHKELRIQLFNHIIEYAKEIKTPMERLNIQPEHIHLLINLPSDVTLSDTVKRLKGESSHWINQHDFLKGKFAWQTGYGAFSVSASVVDTVKSYIENQDNHHCTKTWNEEYNEWLTSYGFDDENR